MVYSEWDTVYLHLYGYHPGSPAVTYYNLIESM